MRRLTSTGWRVTSKPQTSAVPDVGSMNPASIRMVVDFPAPLGPRKPRTSPLAIDMEISSTARSGPNLLVKPLRAIFSVMMAFPGSFF